MGLIKLISEDKKLTKSIEQAIEFLSDNDIDIEEYNLDYYIGSGSFGDVYKVKDKDKVIKFYKSILPDEKKKYDALKEFKGQLKYVCNVYFNRELKKQGIYVVLLDYLEPNDIKYNIYLSDIMHHYESELEEIKRRGLQEDDIEAEMYELARKIDDDITFNDMEERMDIINNAISIDEVRIFIKYSLLNFVMPFSVGSLFNTDKIIDIVESHPNLFEDVYKGIKEFEKTGFKHEDTHMGNILWDPRDKVYKLIDPI